MSKAYIHSAYKTWKIKGGAQLERAQFCDHNDTGMSPLPIKILI